MENCNGGQKMIGFNFEYYKPDTIAEAIELFSELDSSGKKTIYYGGGSEFISMARMNNVYADAVIDIKGIKECNEYRIEGDSLIIGAGVTLTTIAEGNLFPLLSLAVKRIADHTMQGKITIGGNLCGTIIYRESVLPLLVSDSEIVIAEQGGRRKRLLNDIFHGRLQLNNGEMVVKIIVPKESLSLPHLHVKRTKNETIDYPLISMSALKNKDQIKMAFSGLGDYPFRSYKVEDILNDKTMLKEDKIQEAIDSMSDNIKSTLSGTKEYKEFILYNVLDTALKDFKEGK